MTQSTISLVEDLNNASTQEQEIVIAEKVVEKTTYEYQVENLSFNRGQSSLVHWLTSSVERDCSPSDHAVRAVQSIWKKLRN
jgi:hypothetical protein